MTTKKQFANRALWCKALRSGKYKQGRNHLKQGDRYCCLGVAVECVPGVCGDREGVRLDDNDKSYALLGLDSVTETKLISMNDDKKKTFRDIAKYIEKLP